MQPLLRQILKPGSVGRWDLCSNGGSRGLRGRATHMSFEEVLQRRGAKNEWEFLGHQWVQGPSTGLELGLPSRA